ncbi:hypothetical protein DY000_02052889 [Brassica cretica]|uniref:Uncharacterized protein n=1 Tax=Brassica cretica TaxID=69181 RepID=A0ABQ7ABL7_BRACR|nr:hypothetical protein DY000_02052889 [Brassica cretica]
MSFDAWFTLSIGAAWRVSIDASLVDLRIVHESAGSFFEEPKNPLFIGSVEASPRVASSIKRICSSSPRVASSIEMVTILRKSGCDVDHDEIDDLMMIFSHTLISFAPLDHDLVDQNPQKMSHSHLTPRFLYHLTVPNHFALLNLKNLVSSNDSVLGILTILLVMVPLLQRDAKTSAPTIKVSPKRGDGKRGEQQGSCPARYGMLNRTPLTQYIALQLYGTDYWSVVRNAAAQVGLALITASTTTGMRQQQRLRSQGFISGVPSSTPAQQGSSGTQPRVVVMIGHMKMARLHTHARTNERRRGIIRVDGGDSYKDIRLGIFH